MRAEKIANAQYALKSMPNQLRISLLDNNCQIPMPQYDCDGVFKSYLNPKQKTFKEQFD
jgi:hypothetical protein